MYTLWACGDADYEWLRWLHHATMQESVERIWGWDQARQDAYFREHFDPSGRQIVQIEGQDVGVIALEHRPGEVFLADIQIAPGYQGKGIGTALINGIQQQAV